MPSSLIHRAVSTARTVRAVVARPPYVPPGHFYSPLTAEADRSRALGWTEVPGVDLAEDRQLSLAAELAPKLAEPAPGPRYVAANDMYGPADAAVYRAMLAHLRPARVMEVGSGYSTAVALDEAEASREIAALEITCIEPFAGLLLSIMSESDRRRLTLLRKPVQDVDPATYQRLGPGDVLFVDSTHVVKAGGMSSGSSCTCCPGSRPASWCTCTTCSGRSSIRRTGCGSAATGPRPTWYTRSWPGTPAGRSSSSRRGSGDATRNSSRRRWPARNPARSGSARCADQGSGRSPRSAASVVVRNARPGARRRSYGVAVAM